jgi:hypothetical protein
MKKMKSILIILLVTFAVACGQDDKTFTVPIKAYAGVQFSAGGPIQLLPFTGAGGSMVYPGSGIPVSTGTAWGASITNNSLNWDATFNWVNTNGAIILGWGNHAGLYRPITWVPTFEQITLKPTTLAGYGITDAKPFSYIPTYAEITGKPTLFDGTWASLTGKPALFSGSYLDLTNKPTLFSGSYTDLINKPTLFSGSYVDLTNKPTEIDLQAALESLGYLPIPGKTTAEINALVMPVGKWGVVHDNTLNVYKFWNGTIWSSGITGQ